jgi:hypothetical protein
MIFVVLLVGVVVVMAARSRGERGSWRVPFLIIVVVLALGVLTMGLGGSGGGSSDEPARVTLLEPLDATRVASPVSVKVDATNLGAAHLHVLIDHPCAAAGAVIPADATHRHLGASAREVVLELPDGEHSLCVQAGDSGHRAGEARDEITILVGPS